jgi:uncharacterized membrane protein (UPF0127 family)
MNLQISLYNESREAFLAMRVTQARTFWQRLKGWIGKRSCRAGEGLLLTPCRSVHTWFMSVPIDVIYLDQDLRVVGIAERVKPFRFPKSVRRASSVLELPAGTVAHSGVGIFDQLRIVLKEAVE